jgi:predicted cation transporter
MQIVGIVILIVIIGLCIKAYMTLKDEGHPGVLLLIGLAIFAFITICVLGVAGIVHDMCGKCW